MDISPDRIDESAVWGKRMSGVVAEAREFAVRAHGDQRYGSEPYVYHLDAVAGLLVPFGEEAQAVGYLHDVVEDTTIGIDAVRERFGDRVAAYVALVTDEQGANRRERKARTNAKLAAAGPDASVALLVKAADRLANLRESARGGDDSKLRMYRREHPAFEQAAFRPDLCDEFWREMAQLLGRS